ncbi:hypothetical protein N7535_001489 [Penicillium sp. DV-2018c]|nr:hypothetical protein N7461_005266 [Penicillium sp. DV-2018c]KAJ5582869.1 hypothetical protein N7535_001489 [Penicillium sp. DV-2018c]
MEDIMMEDIIMSSPSQSEPTPQTAPRNPTLCPWRKSSVLITEPEDEEASWLTIELKDHTQYLDDRRLVLFMLRMIREDKAVIDRQAQHYIRPMCLSIPCKTVFSSYETWIVNPCEIIRNEAVELLKGVLDEVSEGNIYLDRAVLFDSR